MSTVVVIHGYANNADPMFRPKNHLKYWSNHSMTVTSTVCQAAVPKEVNVLFSVVQMYSKFFISDRTTRKANWWIPKIFLLFQCWQFFYCLFFLSQQRKITKLINREEVRSISSQKQNSDSNQDNNKERKKKIKTNRYQF